MSRARQPGLDSQQGRERNSISSPPRPDRLWGSPSLVYNGYRGLFPSGRSGRCVELTTNFQLVSRLGMRSHYLQTAASPDFNSPTINTINMAPQKRCMGPILALFLTFSSTYTPSSLKKQLKILHRTSGGLLWTRWWTFGFYKRRGNSSLAERLLDSQKGLSSMGLIT
jgi:hypothetical protein